MREIIVTQKGGLIEIKEIGKDSGITLEIICSKQFIRRAIILCLAVFIVSILIVYLLKEKAIYLLPLAYIIGIVIGALAKENPLKD